MQNESKTELREIGRLLGIMAKLRHPQVGCPWDIKQTMQSLTRYTIEEAYEVADAIAGGDLQEIKDELGDLLFQVVFYAQIASEQGEFGFDDVAQVIGDKLVRRHPHVFASPPADKDATKPMGTPLTDESLNAQWDAIKAQEKRTKLGREADSKSILDNVPQGLPALMYAQKLQKACAKVGFDWSEVQPVLDKVREEVDEIQQEIKWRETSAKPDNQGAIEEEIGDALFAMVNLARHCNVDADTALRNASHKFSYRFRAVESLAKKNATPLDTLTLNEMEALWQQVKNNTLSQSED